MYVARNCFLNPLSAHSFAQSQFPVMILDRDPEAPVMYTPVTTPITTAPPPPQEATTPSAGTKISRIVSGWSHVIVWVGGCVCVQSEPPLPRPLLIWPLPWPRPYYYQVTTPSSWSVQCNMMTSHGCV